MSSRQGELERNIDATSPLWTQVNSSQPSWDADALDVLRSLLPDAGPFRVWRTVDRNVQRGGSIDGFELDLTRKDD